MTDPQKIINTKPTPQIHSISEDVTTVEFSRMLKRAGYPQVSKYYWFCDIPTLAGMQDIDALAVEEKRKIKWLLVDQKPHEPSASAYTEGELRDFLREKSIIPTISKSGDRYIGSIEEKPLFYNKNRQNVYALTLLYYLNAR